jgi:alkylation response protein AidB-like acyl-CoA dehydrogenase
MDASLNDRQRARRVLARQVGGVMPAVVDVRVVVARSATAGLLDDVDDILGLALAAEAMTTESAAAGMAFALHATVTHTLADRPEGVELRAGTAVGGLALSSETLPVLEGGLLTGRASWVGPVGEPGVMLVGARAGAEARVLAVHPDTAGVRQTALQTAALPGVRWIDLALEAAPALDLAAPDMTMAVSRILIAAVAVGMGARAVRESLAVVQRSRGAGGEQTVQGLLADSATELDAARVLVWQACTRPGLAMASMAKLEATAAAQQAVARATQVVGMASFVRGHVIEQLTHDVRAIELFAGRTEALREAVAREVLPGSQAPTV